MDNVEYIGSEYSGFSYIAPSVSKELNVFPSEDYNCRCWAEEITAGTLMNNMHLL